MFLETILKMNSFNFKTVPTITLNFNKCRTLLKMKQKFPPLTSGTMTKSRKTLAMTILTQKSHRRKMKYEATTDPKRDSISLMRIYPWNQ